MKSKINEKKCYNIFIENEEEEGESKMGQQCEMIRQEGIRIGKERVKKLYEEKEISYIVAMLKKGYSIDDISDITKKSQKDILSIKEKNKL